MCLTSGQRLPVLTLTACDLLMERVNCLQGGVEQFRRQHDALVPSATRTRDAACADPAPGEPLSKQGLLERVFSGEQDVSPEAVEVLIHRLCKRL